MDGREQLRIERAAVAVAEIRAAVETLRLVPDPAGHGNLVALSEGAVATVVMMCAALDELLGLPAARGGLPAAEAARIAVGLRRRR